MHAQASYPYARVRATRKATPSCLPAKPRLTRQNLTGDQSEGGGVQTMLPCSCNAPAATPSRSTTGSAAVVLKSIENNGHSTAVQRGRRAADEVRLVDV